MTLDEFEELVAEEFDRAIPEQFRGLIKNVAFLVEDEPSPEVCEREGLAENETLLGYYQGVPTPARGDWYGTGVVMPDTITLYKLPIEEEAVEEVELNGLKPEEALRTVIRETIWHEVAHHFGMDEGEVSARERERDSTRLKDDDAVL